jgi:DNA-binding NtrC family response regulator
MEPPASDPAAPEKLVGDHLFVGRSESVVALKAYLGKVARCAANVLVTGDSGTGKELAAELIHRNSARRGGPFVCINCAAIPDGLLESELFGYERGAFTGASAPYEGKLKLADGGTVFFDEIGDMSPYAQAKVLRVIETKEVCRLGGRKSVPLDVRVIAATNGDLEAMVAQGRFRRDLYFRLNVARIHMPLLRDRRQDIPLLLEHYAGQLGASHAGTITFARGSLDCLIHYDWPGNVRELKNLIECLSIAAPSPPISYADLPARFRQPSAASGDPALTGDHPEAREQDRLRAALEFTNWNKSKAAQRLQWSRMTLYRKMAKYQMTRSTGAPSTVASR